MFAPKRLNNPRDTKMCPNDGWNGRGSEATARFSTTIPADVSAVRAKSYFAFTRTSAERRT